MRSCTFAGAVLGLLAAGSVQADQPTPRQEQVHKMGGHVMPFDLDKTLHLFFATPTGGIEKVTARDPADMHQIALIQQHLQREAQLFGDGDFSDPAMIHGQDMPGLADMKAGAKNITFTYTPLPHGASISYDTADHKLVKAIHDWFTAQLNGHDAAAH